MTYEIEYSPEAEEHLRSLTAHQRARVLDTVERQLAHQPNAETKNRRPMRPSPLAPWELRIGNLWVYDDTDAAPRRLVSIRAIGVKDRNRVRIGRKVIEL